MVVDFALINNGGETVTPSTEPVVLSDSEEHEFKTRTLGYAGPAKGIFLNQVDPGVTQL